MRLAFGRHKDELIENVPTEYLSWLLERDWLHIRTRSEIETEMKIRNDPGNENQKGCRRR